MRTPASVRARRSARLAGRAASALTVALAACSNPFSPPPTATPIVITATPAPAAPPDATATVLPTAPATSTPQLTPTVISQEDAVAQVARYTVLVRTDAGGGSGVSLGGGAVLTSYHVVEDAAQVRVRFASGRQDPARVAGVDPRRDLALLRSSLADEPAAPIGDAGSLRPGEGLVAVGYPLSDIIGSEVATVTRGSFSGRRQVGGVWLVQTDTSSNPGNSGGPLADSRGRLVGVIAGGIRGAAGLNFAVASDEVQAFLAGPMQLPLPRASPAAVPTSVPTQPVAASASPTRVPPPPPPLPPTPTRPPDPPPPDRPAPVGLEIRSPADGARVPDRVVVQGIQARPRPAGVHAWLFIRAQVEGSRWYPCPREIVAGADGTWGCEVSLGGASGTRHELVIGVVDDALHGFLSRYVAANPDQPLYPDQPPGVLPRGFSPESAIVVVRQ
jgi:S1-C subfamily serine protease